MINNYKIKSCRSCYSDKLTPVLSLGNQYVTNFVESDSQGIQKCPLEIILCEACDLVQLKHNAPSESMWGNQYWYKSGINRLIKEDLQDNVKSIQNLISLNENDYIVDIGCNDGTLLSFYDHKKENLVGFDPSTNVAKEAKRKGFNVINNFFNAENFQERFGNNKAKAITAISMFYDLEDPNKFLKDITTCLNPEGVFTIQQNYLASMLEQNAFDNICHEHRTYYSLNSLETLLKRHNLEVFDIKSLDINGGSLRTYVKFKNNKKIKGFEGSEKRLEDLRQKEKKLKLNTKKPYIAFANRIHRIKENVLDFLDSERAKGKTFGICGASTRGNTALQYFGLDPERIIAIADANPDKWGKKTVGTLIPIISPEEMKKIKPDYQIVSIWHLFEGLKKVEQDFLKRGGQFILPMPKFKIVKN